VPVTLLSGYPIFEMYPSEEPLHVISLKEALMLEEPLSENPVSIPYENSTPTQPSPSTIQTSPYSTTNAGHTPNRLEESNLSRLLTEFTFLPLLPLYKLS
jgi:hypothetical protein